MSYKIEYSVSVDRLRKVYDFYMDFPESCFVAKELTFTVAPGRCRDIQFVKNSIMHRVVGRIRFSKPIAVILTRENHANGWPHIHGIGWWPRSKDNSLTLSEGRIYERPSLDFEGDMFNGWNGKEVFRALNRNMVLYPELGRVSIDNLRVEPYKQHGKDVEWKNWFDYIIKDQGVKWRCANAVMTGEIDVSDFFSKSDVDTIID